MGFTPLCRVLDDGMSVVSRINAEYQGAPDQGQITAKGNAYLRENFPLLDYVRSARLVTP
jgi:peptidyl-prolyl cis-trans isomerase A (cyclophilin A)